MRILTVGAGGTGGYFGGRLVAAGRDVTFLVRPKRASLLRANGLSIRSPKGDLQIAEPKLVTADRLNQTFDLVLLSCKAYDIEDAIASFAPAVGPGTLVLPLLNGMGHFPTLDERFGSAAVLGGCCAIATTIGSDGAIVHMNEGAKVTFGERDGGLSARVERVAAQLSGAGFDAVLSNEVNLELWSKWVFIAAGAGMTCLMRSAIGDFVAAGAAPLVRQLLDECAAVARAAGYPLSEAALATGRSYLMAAGSPATTSMLRDLEQGGRIESEQIIGDLLRRARTLGPAPMLEVVYAHLKAYEARRERLAAL